MRRKSILSTLGKIEGLPIAAVLALLYIIFIFTAPLVFSKYLIYMSFFETVPPQLVLGLALTFVITAGEIDLSFPAVVALSGFIFSRWFKTFGEPWTGFVLALASGALVGYVNGFMVAKIKIPSIMATLAAQFFWYGVTILIANGLQLNILEIVGTPIHNIFVGRIFGVLPAQALWSLGLTVFLWFILNRHKFGEAIMFIGDNSEVARVMGINVESTKITLFTMNGVLAAFAGLLLTMEINVFYPTQGSGFLLNVMAAVFIGGTSIAGGMGVLVGTFFGSYIIGSLDAGVVASGIGGYWVTLVKGFLMGASISLNAVIGDGRLARTASRISHWIVPERGKGSDAASK